MILDALVLASVMVATVIVAVRVTMSEPWPLDRFLIISSSLLTGGATACALGITDAGQMMLSAILLAMSGLVAIGYRGWKRLRQHRRFRREHSA